MKIKLGQAVSRKGTVVSFFDFYNEPFHVSTRMKFNDEWNNN